MLVGGQQCDGGLRFDCRRRFFSSQNAPYCVQISHLFQKGHLQFAFFFFPPLPGFCFRSGGVSSLLQFARNCKVSQSVGPRSRSGREER